MSEKRFVKDHSYLVNYDKYCILDKGQHKHLYLDEVCNKLNEQQATISALKEENEEYAKIIEQAKRYENGLWVRFTKLEKENEQLRQEIERLKKELDEKCP